MTTDYMQGWDVIVATRQKQINQGIKRAYDEGMIPKDFNQKMTFEFLGTKIDVTISGTFGTMQVVGGTGQVMQILLPVEKGTIEGAGGFKIDIKGTKVIVSLNLTFVESQVKPKDGYNYDITIDFTKQDAWVGINLIDLPPVLEQQRTAIAIALTDYLRKNTGGQSYRIATVNLKNYADQPEFKYVVPKLVQYAMLTSTQSADQNIFAMLLQSVSASPGKAQLLDGTIPTGFESAVLVSNPLFMQHMIAPAIAKGFNIDATALAATGNPMVISNTMDITAKVDADGEKEITIQRLAVQVTDNSLSIELKIRYVVSPGINLIYTISPSRYSFEIVEKDGKKQLELREVEFKASKDVEMEWWVWVLGGAAAILLLPIVGIIISAILAGIAMAIIAIIGAIVKDKAPDLKSSVIVGAAKPVQWNYASIFSPQKVLMPGALQTAGTIPFLAGKGERVQIPVEKLAEESVTV